MYKRPPLRVNTGPPKIHDPTKIPQNSFLYKLLNPPPTKFYTRVKQPVYRKNDYLALLEKNCNELGIPYVKPDIPEYEAPTLQQKNVEPDLQFADQVYMKLRILKSGIVRVKLDTSFTTLYEKYYSKVKKPPSKVVIQSYKSMGFSEEFLKNLKNNFERKAGYQKIVDKIIERVFNKEPVKKTKKKKEEIPEEVEEEPQDDDEEQDDDGPEEDEALDVEIDEDLEEQQQEEYFSDGGD